MKIYQETNSSVISSYEYDIDTSVLVVTYKSGLSYRYFDVDKETFANLQVAPSVGNFISTQIKRFRYERIEDEKIEEYKPEIDLSNRARWPFPTGPKPVEQNYTSELEWTPEEEAEFLKKVTKDGDII